MSTRTRLVSVASIEPIRDAVASGDKALVEAIIARHASDLREESGDEDDLEDEAGEEDEEFREYVESMIACRKPPRAEPGCWNYVIEPLAAQLKLSPDDDLPFNEEDWKHYGVWEEYRDAVSGHVTAESARSLKHLEEGRPLRGSRIDHDGCAFAWLAPEEVKEMHRSLSGLDPDLFEDGDLGDFHEGLVSSLKRISDRGAALFLAAS